MSPTTAALISGLRTEAGRLRHTNPNAAALMDRQADDIATTALLHDIRKAATR